MSESLAALTALRSIESKLDQVISLLTYPPHVLAEATEAPEPEDDTVHMDASASIGGGVLEKLMADAQAALFAALLKPKK